MKLDPVSRTKYGSQVVVTLTEPKPLYGSLQQKDRDWRRWLNVAEQLKRECNIDGEFVGAYFCTGHVGNAWGIDLCNVQVQLSFRTEEEIILYGNPSVPKPQGVLKCGSTK